MSNKGKGGSYVRNEDGSTTLVERTGWKPPKSKSESKRRAQQGKAADKSKTRNVKGD